MAEIRIEPAGAETSPVADLAETLAGMTRERLKSMPDCELEALLSCILEPGNMPPEDDRYLETLWHLFHVHDDVLER